MPTDLRTQKLAKLLVKYSVFVKPDENVIISGSTESEDLLLAIYKEVILAGAHPVFRMSPKYANYFFLKHAKKHQIEKYPDITELTLKKCQKFIGVGSEYNTRELTNIDPKKITARGKVTHKITELICQNKPAMHRVSTSYPTNALAQDAEMSLTEYEKFFYDACLLDWKSLSKKMHKIASYFKKNSSIHLIGKNVDLKMKVYGDLLTVCDGKENMPDGELCMAPLIDSLEGWIKFDFPAIRDGKEVTDVFLRFQKGRVVESKASKNEDFLKEMLAVDENSNTVGELGIGCNPKVNKFTKDLLFDEKIGGTIHLALGMPYKENIPQTEKRDSSIHWDIVKDMKQAKIIVDGKVIQENGKWKL